MKIRPHDDYELLGTRLKLDKTKIYDAELATNLPEYLEKGKIFVGEHGFPLEAGDYTIISE